MRKIPPLDRLLLLGTTLLAAYQVSVGIDGLPGLPTVSYTIAFGVLLVAALLLIIFGFEILESTWVVVVAALIPVSLAVGLVAQHFPGAGLAAIALAVGGLLAILVTRLAASRRAASLVLSGVHGVAGLAIVTLPIACAASGMVRPGFALVGLGGALIGLGGLLLAFVRAGRPILTAERIFSLLPALLLATTAAFVAGFALS